MRKNIAPNNDQPPKAEPALPEAHPADHPRSQAFYQALFNAVNDAIVLVDPQTWSLVEVNDKFCQLLGVSRAEAQGLSITALFTGEFPYSRAEASERLQRALQEEPQLFEWLAQDRDGRRHWVELNLTTAPLGPKRYLIATVRDIQARKEAEQQAKQNDSAITALMHAMQDVALLLDPEGRIMAANATAARRLQRPLPELIGLNVFELMPPELARTRKAKADEVLRTGRVSQFEDEHSGVCIFNILYPIFDASGRVMQVGVYALDVTAEKKTKRELDRTKARLECLLDHSPVALYSRHPESCELLYISNNINNLIGFSQEEILADPFLWGQHIHPGDRQQFAATHTAGMLTGGQSQEYQFRHQDGTYRWLHDESNLIRDQHGKPLEYIGSLTDITAAKEAQKKLALSEKRYRAMVEGQTDLINLFKPDTTLLYVNEATCRFMGQSQEELLGRSFLPFLTLKDQQLITSYIRSLTPEHPMVEYEQEIVMPGRSTRWLNWITSAFFDDQGRMRELQGVGRDITRRKEAEEALRQSELRFRLYTESSLVGIFMIQDNLLAYVNPTLAEIFGYPPEEMAQKVPLDFIHPDDAEFVEAKIAQRLAGVPPERYSFRGLRQDGTVVHCEAQGHLVDFQGRPAILGSLLDVSQQVQAEAARQESEKQSRLLVETMNDGLGAMDEQQRITYINPKMCELFGYQENELIGRPVTDLLDPTNQKTLQDNLGRRQRGDQTAYELVWTRKDGSQFPSIVSPKPIFDAQGRFKGSFAIITDITARREAEIAVQRREQYFRQLTDNVSDVFGLLTAEGNISYVNPTINRLLGYQPQQLLGKSAFELIHPDDVPLLEKIFSRLRRQSNENFAAEVQVRHRHGSWHIWAIKGKNLLNDPVVAGIVINAQDITEQKNLEAALKQSAQKLRLLTAQIFTAQETERRRLSLELHDELGQSLTALKLQLRSIANKLRKDQTRLKQECTQMLAYINEVVEDVRRLSHDLSPSLLDNVGLGAALHHLLENYRKFYRITENLHEIAGTEELLPDSSKIHLYRIFQEVLTNIERHSQATEVKVEVVRTENRLSFSIADNGRGLPAEFKDRPGGTGGLGLPSINERILMLGGTLKIFSQEDAGTQIEFTVPLQKNNPRIKKG
jgi:PAS domain S-box-containing protein